LFFLPYIEYILNNFFCVQLLLHFSKDFVQTFTEALSTRVEQKTVISHTYTILQEKQKIIVMLPNKLFVHFIATNRYLIFLFY
jgi:hypothetical protein